MKMKFCSQKRVIINKNRVIVNNKKNGQWIKLSLECYEILNYAIGKGLTKQKLIDELYDEEDRNYIRTIIDKMEKLEILYTETEEIKNVVLDSVTLSITASCNLRCKHCCISAEQTVDEIPLDIMKRRVKKIVDCKPLNIILTGGEPLYYKNFKEIVVYIRSIYSGGLCLLTNGTLINDNNIFFIVHNFNSINISLDGFDKKTCENIRGANVFEHVKKAVYLLKNNGMKSINLSMTVTRYTDGHEREFNQLCESWGVEGSLRRFAPIGRGKENEKDLFNIEQEFYHNQLCEKKQGINSSDPTGPFVTVCAAFEQEFYIGSDGYLYPCGALCMDEFKIEKIDAIDDLKSYMENKSYLNTNGYNRFYSIQPENSHHCSQCSIRLFCTGCPVYIYLYEQRGYLDEYCKNRKENNESLIWSEEV